jgi:uncharacterized protein YjlB
MKNKLNPSATISHFFIKDNGIFPNNALLPAVLIKAAWKLPFINRAGQIQKHLKDNQWGNSWKNGVYGYHHYHSIAHEVMCVYKGKTQLILGGDDGVLVEVEQGDVLILPAGVAHKNLGPGNFFKCVGAYPFGQDFDMNYGKPEERPKADSNIKKVPLPKQDPVFGSAGPLKDLWKI